MKKLILSLVLAILFLSSSPFSSAQSTTKYYFCEGSGEKCEAKATVGEQEITVKSEKKTGSASVRVEVTVE